MEIRFFLTARDVWNFQKYSLWRRRTILPLILSVALILAIGLFSSLTSSPSNVLVNLLPIIVGLGVLVLVVVLLQRRVYGGMARRLAAQGEQVISISPEGFRHKNNLTGATTSWVALKAIKADTYNLYFMVDSNVTLAHLIPRRAFATPQDAEAFLGWARHYWANGQGIPQPQTPGSNAGYERWS